jgi:hypothetical protein
MRNLGIIQPGKVGDIIILLPIAKYYYDLGYKIIWPIDASIINNFVNHVDYVNFIPCSLDCNDARRACFKNDCNTILDLSFSIPNANIENTKNYFNQNKYSFDEFKYYLANVPFEEKWNLKINRNLEREQELYLKLAKTKDFAIIQEYSSDNKVNIKLNKPNIQEIHIMPYTDCVFDWITLLEKSKYNAFIESCFSNLVDQLKIEKENNFLIKKNGYYRENLEDGWPKGMPRLKLNWKIK